MVTTEPRRQSTFDATDGSIFIDGITTNINPRLRSSELPSDLTAMINSRRALATGWTWIGISDVVFADNPCSLSLGFYHDCLAEVSWSVRVVGLGYTGSWPSPDAVAKELKLVTRILIDVFGAGGLQGRGDREPTRYRREFPWGSVWCELDPRAGTCAASTPLS